MSSQPSVSVLMPVRDAEQYVREAVESLLSQTFPDFELVIVDDGSVDGTPENLATIGDPRVRMLRNASPRGVAASLNHAANEARGRLLARLDADDVAHPERLERQLSFLDQHPEIALLGTSAWLVDEQGRTLGRLDLPLEHAALRWEMCLENPFVHSSVMLRREAFDAVGGYAPRLRRSQDYDLWHRLALRFRVANLPDHLVALRRHAASVSHTDGSEMERLATLTTRRSLAALIEADVPETDASLLRALGRGERLAATDIHRGLHLLRKSLRAALGISTSASEAEAVLEAGTRRLVQVAVQQAPRHPSLSLRLLRYVASIRPTDLLAVPARQVDRWAAVHRQPAFVAVRRTSDGHPPLAVAGLRGTSPWLSRWRMQRSTVHRHAGRPTGVTHRIE